MSPKIPKLQPKPLDLRMWLYLERGSLKEVIKLKGDHQGGPSSIQPVSVGEDIQMHGEIPSMSLHRSKTA